MNQIQWPPEVQAESSTIRQSARKLQLVTRSLKGLSAAGAIEVLPYIVKTAADPIRKTIVQAMANASKTFKIPENNIGKMKIEVMQGPTMKRFRVGGRGRVKPVLKRTSRIIVRLAVKNKEPKNGTKS